MFPLDLDSLRAAYASGSLTPAALIADLERRINDYADPALWIHRLSHDEVMGYAERITGRDRGSLPLYGVPFAIKDNIDLAGAPTTAACPEFAYRPAASAFVVQRLIDAGAIPIGKVNLDQFATGLVGVRSPYGVPRNPFRADVIPGGSSSGSAVAVAAGLVSFSLGTDTAGSGRIPAGLNNLVGLKPTRGALSTRGVVPACRSLDCVSIFALTQADATTVLRVAEGYDDEDPFSRRRPANRRSHRGNTETANPSGPTESFPRIGVPALAELSFFGDSEAEHLFRAALDRIRSAGAEVVEIDFAVFRDTADLLYQGPWIAERWTALREFHATYANAFHPITRQIVERGAIPSAADGFAGMHRLAELHRRAEREWKKMDVLVVPTAPRPYTLAEVAAEPVLANTRLGTYTNFVNLLDLAAVALPAGMRSDGIPWGVTVIAPAWEEELLLGFGARWEAGRQANVGPPSLTDVWDGNSHSVLGTDRSSAKMNSPHSMNNPTPPAKNAQFQTASSVARLAVVGAHLSGLPLNHQLTDRGGKLAWAGNTAPSYRLYALPGTTPPKPGLIRVAQGGAAVAVEVWELPMTEFGSFVAAIPPPLGVGSILLASGDAVKGFLCESVAVADATDITSFGGWRAYLASLAPSTSP